MRGATIGRVPRAAALGLGLVVVLAGAGEASQAGAPTAIERAVGAAVNGAGDWARAAAGWYRRTPPGDRVAWAGLAACAVLGSFVMLERGWRLRRGRVVPSRFVDRFLERLREGPLDRGKAQDLCELNPSPAARVVAAALRRWGRAVADLERAVSLARRVEVEGLSRGLGTLRRVAAMAPLIGLLGSLLAAGRALEAVGGPGDGAWGPALAGALAPATAGVALAILALVAFDGLTGRVEKLASELDRLGAETIDAMAIAAPAPTPVVVRSAREAESPRPSAVTHRGPHFGPIAPRPVGRVRRAESDEDLMEF